MYRVYCLIGAFRYYWTGAFWSQWSWAAKPLPRVEAEQFAEAAKAHTQPMGG